mmetsp:Transcript_44848/g.142335  ORF Transcript_44848/g.142335 Transcript_44848/m.142335 type:complete len:86 (-) Transcript_44848:183-440(-)
MHMHMHMHMRMRMRMRINTQSLLRPSGPRAGGHMLHASPHLDALLEGDELELERVEAAAVQLLRRAALRRRLAAATLMHGPDVEL